MKGYVEVFGENFEYDFLSGWIKYNRLQDHLSQEVLAHGICSKSHLSYFENGKKKLRGEIIEALLKKLNIHHVQNLDSIGSIRQKLYNMLLQIESLNYDEARVLYNEVSELESLIAVSPYNIEYKIYQLVYKTLVTNSSYVECKEDIENLDNIYTSLSKELQYLFMFVSGKLIYRFVDHNQGLERLLAAYHLKENPWINHELGVSYCYNNKPLTGTYHLKKALENYEKNGRYINAVWCHSYLGRCYTDLKLYNKAESHFNAALSGAKHFNMKEILYILYVNMADLALSQGNYEESLKWSEKAFDTDGDSIIVACNYIDACTRLGRVDECSHLFDKYLTNQYKDSLYYPLLKFLYLSIFNLNEAIFYETVTKKILPFYEKNYYVHIGINKTIKLKLIEHLENNRKYKEATQIYKELLAH